MRIVRNWNWNWNYDNRKQQPEKSGVAVLPWGLEGSVTAWRRESMCGVLKKMLNWNKSLSLYFIVNLFNNEFNWWYYSVWVFPKIWIIIIIKDIVINIKKGQKWRIKSVILWIFISEKIINIFSNNELTICYFYLKNYEYV